MTIQHVLACGVFISWTTTRSLIDATYPGQCTTAKDCERYQGSGSVLYQCVSVRTERKGITSLSQCIPNPPCSGLTAGYCPVFSGWSKRYQDITTVCGYARPTNCLSDPANRDKDPDTLVQCQNVTLGDASSHALVIYQCIDGELYADAQSELHPNATAQLRACAGARDTSSSDSDVSSGQNLCNGHGTCMPLVAFSQAYGCQCNRGYNVSDNCLKAVSNDCSLPGQCGLNGECRVFEGTCECKTGFRGNQCSLCDASSGEDACNGNGQCQNNGTCDCNLNFEGQFCERDLGDSKASNNFVSFSRFSILVVVVMLLGDVLSR